MTDRRRTHLLSLFALASLVACSDSGPVGSGGALGQGGIDPSGGGGGAEAGGPTTGGAPTSGGGPSGGATGSGGAEPIVFQDAYPITATYPEGGAYDADAGRFYFGSLESGTVHSIDARTGIESELFTEPAPGTWMTLGMAVDAPRKRLWVCAADQDSDPYRGELWVFDLEAGARTHVIPLHAGADDAWCEDVAVDSTGAAYATDRENPNIYRVGSSMQPSLFATDPELGSNLIGQNGVVALPGDQALIATIHFPPQLNRIAIPSGVVTPITIDGDFADATLGSGPDGMVYRDGALFVVFDGELVRLDPTLADWSAVSASAVELTGGLTDLVSTPAGLYLQNGQAIGFVFGQDPAPFQLVRYAL